MVSRRTVLMAAPAVLSMIPPGAFAQRRYPDHVIRIVVGNSAGGADDALSRAIADKLALEYGVGVIVDNRSGGSTTIGAINVANSAPDGYSLLCLVNAGIAQTALRDKLPYSLKSFVPVVGIGGFPLVLAGSAATEQKVTTMQELITLAKRPDGVTYASAGVGTMAHLNTLRLLKAIGGQGLHVPYKNNPEALQALMGGSTQIMMGSASDVVALRSDGRLRALAVTSAQRLPSLPDVPTMQELGFGTIDAKLWFGFMAPAGTPPEIVAKLADSSSRIVKTPDFHNRFKQFSFQEDIKTGEALSAYVAGEATRWREVIAENNIKITD